MRWRSGNSRLNLLLLGSGGSNSDDGLGSNWLSDDLGSLSGLLHGSCWSRLLSLRLRCDRRSSRGRSGSLHWSRSSDLRLLHDRLNDGLRLDHLRRCGLLLFSRRLLHRARSNRRRSLLHLVLLSCRVAISHRLLEATRERLEVADAHVELVEVLDLLVVLDLKVGILAIFMQLSELVCLRLVHGLKTFRERLEQHVHGLAHLLVEVSDLSINLLHFFLGNLNLVACLVQISLVLTRALHHHLEFLLRVLFVSNLDVCGVLRRSGRGWLGGSGDGLRDLLLGLLLLLRLLNGLLLQSWSSLGGSRSGCRCWSRSRSDHLLRLRLRSDFRSLLHRSRLNGLGNRLLRHRCLLDKLRRRYCLLLHKFGGRLHERTRSGSSDALQLHLLDRLDKLGSRLLDELRSSSLLRQCCLFNSNRFLDSGNRSFLLSKLRLHLSLLSLGLLQLYVD